VYESCAGFCRTRKKNILVYSQIIAFNNLDDEVRKRRLSAYLLL